MAIKQDSNLTGLRFAEEASLRTLPSPESNSVWFGLEPNTYNDFGGQLRTVSRNPINPSRQRKKGTTVDLDASGGFNQDLTMNNLTRMMQGFFFADARQKPSTIPLNGAAVPCTSVSNADSKYNFGADPGDFVAGDVVRASGFGASGNNQVFTVASSDADDVTATATVDEASPPATAKLEKVGVELGSGTSAIALNGNLVRLTDSGTDLTTLGLIAGEWLFLGGDQATQRFANNLGFARVSAIAAGYLEFDKVAWTPAVEAGTGKTIRLFFGTLIRNEPAVADIVRRTYQIERTLGEDADGEMSEYLVGAVANEMTLNVPQADKVTVDLSYVALDNEQRSGLVGVKDGARPEQDPEEAINTSNDFSRISLSLVDATDATVAPLFAYATDVAVTVNNNVSALKAIGTLGGFDTTAGTFEVSGSLTVYFADVAAVQAVRNNADVTLDVIMVKGGQGIIADIPLVSLGDGRLTVEADQPIKLPLETNAAQSVFGYTMALIFFPYLPAVAA